MSRYRPTRRARRLLLPILMTATVVVFLAPTAQADTVIAVTKSALPADPGPVSPGDTITYSIAINNQGAEDATNVTLADPTPAGTTYVDDSAQINGGAPIAGGNPFDPSGSVGTVTAGTTTIVTFDVTVNSPLADGTIISNTATVDADNENPASSTLTDSTAHTVSSSPSLAIGKTAVPAEGGTVSPGDTISYSILVESVGTDTATAVTVTDPLPSDTTYVPNSAELDGT